MNNKLFLTVIISFLCKSDYDFRPLTLGIPVFSASLIAGSLISIDPLSKKSGRTQVITHAAILALGALYLLLKKDKNSKLGINFCDEDSDSRYCIAPFIGGWLSGVALVKMAQAG